MAVALALLAVVVFVVSVAFVVSAIVATVRGRGARRDYLAAGVIFVGSLVLLAVAVIVNEKDESAPAAMSVPSAMLTPAMSVVPRPMSAIAFPQYLELRSGQMALLDSNGEGDANFGTLFDDFATVERWTGGESDPAHLPHHDLPVGTRLKIESWQFVTEMDGKRDLMVKVATTTPPLLSGYTRDIWLLPDIPIGTQLVASSAFFGHKTVSMTLRQNKSTSIEIAAGTMVTLVAEHPADALPVYRARVMSGVHRGQVGWFDAFSLAAPSPAITSGEYDEHCRCLSLYFIDRAYAALHPPTAGPAATPDLGPITDDDKAYMTEACNLMYPNGSGYGFDFGANQDEHANMRIVTCSGDADQLIYFRREHLAETKTRYANQRLTPETPRGYIVPKLNSNATPFPSGA